MSEEVCRDHLADVAPTANYSAIAYGTPPLRAEGRLIGNRQEMSSGVIGPAYRRGRLPDVEP